LINELFSPTPCEFCGEYTSVSSGIYVVCNCAGARQKDIEERMRKEQWIAQKVLAEKNKVRTRRHRNGR